jgi:hypothetical protein
LAQLTEVEPRRGVAVVERERLAVRRLCLGGALGGGQRQAEVVPRLLVAGPQRDGLLVRRDRRVESAGVLLDDRQVEVRLRVGAVGARDRVAVVAAGLVGALVARRHQPGQEVVLGLGGARQQVLGGQARLG